MRLTSAVIVLVALPAIAMAQTAERQPQPPGSLPPIGLPLPPIGLPLPDMGLPAAGDTQPITDLGVPPENQRPPRNRRGNRGLGSTVFFVPTYGWGALAPGEIAPEPWTLPEAPPAAREQQPQLGALRLEIVPPHAQLFVNGEYIGTPEDFNGELALAAGSHTFEIRAAGYETLVVSVRIAPGRSITYRGELKRIQREPEARGARAPSRQRPEASRSQPPAPQTTFYYIPGCYMGNLPPEKVALPANCDLSRLITRRY
jgi:hypothetical protein